MSPEEKAKVNVTSTDGYPRKLCKTCGRVFADHWEGCDQACELDLDFPPQNSADLDADV